MFFMQTSGIHIQRIITMIEKMLDTPTAQSAPVFPCVKVTWSFGAFKVFIFFSRRVAEIILMNPFYV